MDKNKYESFAKNCIIGGKPPCSSKCPLNLNIPALVMTKCKFGYVKLEFYSEVPRCSKCRQVYLLEDLVRERIQKVEANLEDK